jgi:very-short-patch-repair endonuclease
VVARRQLLAAGLSRTVIARRLRSGRLHELHRGVYLVGHTIAPPFAHEAAAVLACGQGAVLSHRSAGGAWDLLYRPASLPISVTVPPARYVERPGIEIHRAALAPRDVRRRHRLLLTSPPRTILDLASVLDLSELERAVAEAHYRRLASDEELREQVDTNPGRPGISALRAVLDLPSGASRTRSPAERWLLRLLRNGGFTGYETNAVIHGYEVDVLWRDLDFAIEVDGYDAHSGRVAFERDRLKIATLKAKRLDVMPVTGRQLRDDAVGVLDRMRAALALARARRGRMQG